MIDFIRSKLVQEYHSKSGFSFTDRQKATLIWKSRQYKRKDILDSLQELAETTEDKVLKKQIEERLTYEELKLTQLKENPEKRFVYVIFDENYFARGFFQQFEAAYEYAIEKRTVCEIEKQQIVDGFAPLFTTALYHVKDKYYDPFKLESDYVADCDYFGGPVARCRLDESGEIQFLASVEVSGPEWYWICDETFSYEADRFENEYVNIPYPEWYLSGKVKNVLTGEYGVTNYEDYKERKEWDDSCEGFESDLIGVYFLKENGCWYYDLVNPFYLDCGGPDPEENMEVYMATEAFCSYYMGEHETLEEAEEDREQLINWCRAYARNCIKGPSIFHVSEGEDFLIYD